MEVRRVAYIVTPIMILAFLIGFPAYLVLGQESGSSPSATVTVTAQPAYRPPAGGWGGWGGGGGGSAECPPGQVSTAGKITVEGSVIRAFVIESFDKRLSLIFAEGTVVLTPEGICPACIGIQKLLESPHPPEDAYVISLMYDVVPDGSTFTPPATIKYSYDSDDIPEGVAEESLVIACYDWANDKWIKLDSIVDIEANMVTAKISKFNDLAVFGYKAEAPMPATFECSSLSISPNEVNIGETVYITVLVTNTGGQSGIYLVMLKINGMVEAKKNVVLNPGVSQEVSFSTAKDAAGNYSVDVNGLSGTFVVKEKAIMPSAEPKPAIPTWGLIGGIIAAAVTAFVIFMVRRMAHKSNKR